MQLFRHPSTTLSRKSRENNRRSFDFGRFAASAQDDSSGFSFSSVGRRPIPTQGRLEVVPLQSRSTPNCETALDGLPALGRIASGLRRSIPRPPIAHHQESDVIGLGRSTSESFHGLENCRLKHAEGGVGVLSQYMHQACGTKKAVVLVL